MMQNQDELQIYPKIENSPQLCILHNKNFEYFCESCEEPICHLCTILGPHNFKLHRCNNLQDAFSQRVYKIQGEIKNNLLPIREELFAQIHRIEYRIEEIKYVSSIIEKDARAEMGGILQRLIHQVGIKQAILQHEAQEIQKDINEINDLRNEFLKITNKETEDQIGFLLNSEQIYEKIEFLIAKPYKQGIDVVPDDLPKELTQLRLESGKIQSQKEILDLLNNIIWTILNDKKEEENQLQIKLQTEAKSELQEWVKLVDHFNDQLKEQQLVCYFCNQRIDEKVINKKCKKNKSVPQTISAEGFTKEKPQDQNMGSSRHFWGHSREESILKDLLRPENKKIPNFVLIETIISKIKQRSQQYKIDLKEIFKTHDKEQNGQINHIHFAFILSDFLSLTTEEIELLTFFIDDEQKGIIFIEDILNYLKSEQIVQQRANYLANTYKSKKETHQKPQTYHTQQ